MDRVFQRLPIDQFHDDVVRRAVLPNVKNADHIGVRQAGRETSLLLEPPKEVRIVRELAEQNLYCDAPPEPEVLGLMHPRHAAFAQNSNQAIPSAENIYIHGHKGSMGLRFTASRLVMGVQIRRLLQAGAT
ncbi:MAG: hypothetical protein JWO42_3976 [Chloroflexi bacterium]|nr:hypothetical protein [Chloroflexota bacterium]